MQLQIFEYEKEQEVRTVEVDGEIWWVASDICKVLSLDNVTKAISALDNDEKNTITLSKGIRGNPNVNIRASCRNNTNRQSSTA